MDIKTSHTISEFKSKLKKEMLKVNNYLDYHYYGSRKVNSILASMRLRCSSLKYDLYRNNIIENSVCECGMTNETIFHFFFECERYTVIRNEFMNICSGFQNVNINIILNGCSELSKDDNMLLHDAVSNFIISSHRF